jgi:uncharacterized protein (TIGR02246 family)
MKGLTMTSHNPSADRAADDRAVRAVLDGVYAAWAVNDAEALIAPYAPDAAAVLPGSYLAGRDEIRAVMTDAFAGPLNGSRAGYEVQSIRFPDAGTAIVISKGAIVLAGETGPRAENRALETWVLSRDDGTWRVRAFHSCPREAPEPGVLP